MKRTTTFVSIALLDGLTIATRRLVEHGLMHLLDRYDAVDRPQTNEDVFDPSSPQPWRRAQQEALRPLFDDQLGAGAKTALVADRLGEDDLPFGRDLGLEARSLRRVVRRK